ncbi:MAG: hypothetical protein NTZ39_10490, partial [Methanoregula sp.]|nr:hypothetical protein [Methanoregula sp.]
AAVVPGSCHTSAAFIAGYILRAVGFVPGRRGILSDPQLPVNLFCPDRNIVMVPVHPLHADAEHIITLLFDLPGDHVRDEEERDLGLAL